MSDRLCNISFAVNEAFCSSAQRFCDVTVLCSMVLSILVSTWPLNGAEIFDFSADAGMLFYEWSLNFINLFKLFNWAEADSGWIFLFFIGIKKRMKTVQMNVWWIFNTKPFCPLAVWGLMFLKRLWFFPSSVCDITSQSWTIWLSSSWLTPQLIGRRGSIWLMRQPSLLEIMFMLK